MDKIEQLETDYLIIGAGAMGLAFADEILKHDKSALVMFVERRGAVGGHWVDAYDHVKLHQPAIAYGVNSLELSESDTDLSSRPQIINYFERISKRYLNSGRARFLFKCDYVGEQELDKGFVAEAQSNIDSDLRYTIHVRRKIVDSGYMRVEVPSTHPPAYQVANDVDLIPPNGLSKLERAHEKYLIVGAGKTGIDAILYLLDNGVSAERIHWVISNDMWMWPREMASPKTVGGMLLGQLKAIIDSSNIDEAFMRMEREGIVFRLDKNVMPTKWRCATVSMPELEQLKAISNITRAGRVSAITNDVVRFESGQSLQIGNNTLVVNCSANGLSKRPAQQIFEQGRITLQPVLICQQVFSAAYIGKLETTRLSDEAKNAISHPVPHPERVEDLPFCLVQSFENQIEGNKKIAWWLWRSRLNLMGRAPLLTYLSIGLKLLKLTPLGRRALSKYHAALSSNERVNEQDKVA